MAYHAHKSKRKRDPFAVQSLPKSFYHPSPQKDVNEKEAIQSPVRKNPPVSQCALEEQFLRGSPTYKASALQNVRTLSNDIMPVINPIENQEGAIYNSGQFDETWPDNEGPTSASASQNISEMTLVTDHAVPAGPKTSITDIVMGLEKLKFQPREAADHKDKAGHHDQEMRGDSVLQRYIERFRNAAPMSREERMKERERQIQEFWWLRSSQDSTANTTADGDKNKQPSQSHRFRGSKLEPPTGSTLTKEALQAMDEETRVLQSKAEMLLSRSELSLASSGPIVSTDGLGTSSSVSDRSMLSEDPAPYRPAPYQPSYRPAFIRAKDSYHRPPAHVEKRGIDQPWKSPADDILARWRLRRKMEEAGTTPSISHHTRAPQLKPHKHTEMDSRLEDFRKKILSYKDEITVEDIQFERQKMSLLLEDDKQECRPETKENPPGQQHANMMTDPILQRLHKITGSKDARILSHPQNGAPSFDKQNMSHFIQDYGAQNLNVNNANINSDRSLPEKGASFSTAMLNKNNTASMEPNINDNNNVEPEPTMDTFTSQVVCDPNQKVFILGDGGNNSVISQSVHTDIADGGNSKHVESANSEEPQGDLTSHSHGKDSDQRESLNRDVQKSNSREKDVKEQKDTEHEETVVFSKASESSRKRSHETHMKKVPDKKPKDPNKEGHVKHAGEKLFHQYLEAEKPISEVALEKNKMHASDVRDRISNKERQSHEGKKTEQCASEYNDIVSGGEQENNVTENSRRHDRGYRKKKHRHSKPKSDSTEEMCESDALTDITNESDRLCKSLERRSDVLSQRSASDKQSQQLHSKWANSDVSDRKSRPTGASSEPVSARHFNNVKSSAVRKPDIHTAIGQAITEHLFDGSTLVSSVDSWASMFPQSPAPSQSLYETCFTTPSPSKSKRDEIMPQHSPVPLQSTPKVEEPAVPPQEVSSEDYQSDGEYEDDPLLQLLRQQRNQYLQQLELIEEKLQELGTQS